MIELATDDLEKIKLIGEATYPYECCGIMVGALEDGIKIVTKLIPAENKRTDSPQNRYLITSGFLKEVEQELRGTNLVVVGFFHSHPDVPARPSCYDLEHAWPWYSYLIVSIHEGKAQEIYNWILDDDRSRFQSEELKIFKEA